MSPKKQYQKKLPAALPPRPREEPQLEEVREAIRRLVHDLDSELGPATTQSAPPAPPAARTAPPEAAPAAPTKPAARSTPAAPVRTTAAKPSAARPATAPPPVRPAARPVADPPEERRRPTRTVALLALVLLLAVAAGGGLVAWWLRGDGPADAPAAGSADVAPGWPAEASSRTVTRVGPDGTLDVTQWIHTAEPIDSLDLTLPDASDTGTVRAYDVAVEADGRPGTGPGEITFTQSSYVFESATRIRVRYRLSGVVERSGSATGRALATTTALQVSATQPRDVRVVRSGAVLTLACDRPGPAEPAPCGEELSEGEWRVTLEGADVGARVIAAVTLPS